VTSISNTQDDFLWKFSLNSKAWKLYYHACWQGDFEQGLFELGERSGKLYHPRERNENRGIFHRMSAAQYRPERGASWARAAPLSLALHTPTQEHIFCIDSCWRMRRPLCALHIRGKTYMKSVSGTSQGAESLVKRIRAASEHRNKNHFSENIKYAKYSTL